MHESEIFGFLPTEMQLELRKALKKASKDACRCTAETKEALGNSGNYYSARVELTPGVTVSVTPSKT